MIVFENEGLIPTEAFTTFGINAKPNSENPIGYFGTGLKYAVAVTLRLGGTFRLYRGTTEYEFYTKDIDFRGKDFTTIRMRKRKSWNAGWSYEKLPFTTELGKNWEPWMAVRELESNTRDENGTSRLDDGFKTDENRTVIAIQCPAMEEAYQNLGRIFLPEKKLLAVVGPVEIYEGESDFIFYRGLRVTDLDRKSLFTYNFTIGIFLTEDRTSKYPTGDVYRIMESLTTSTDTDIIKRIMQAEDGQHYEASFPWDQPFSTPSASYLALLSDRIAKGWNVPKRMKTYYDDVTKEDEVDRFLDVRLLRSQIEDLISHLEVGSSIKNPQLIIERLQGALK